ncbi:MAG: sulfurtransferase TusA family protein [Candidatus Poseidoniaceae archaeon]|nr:sulfurtransferase TusA family protein [Candidatus Poseidoniaceae archaeon]
MVEVVSLGNGSMVLPTHQLDVIGFFCPVPVAEAKKALSNMDVGQILELLADDPETVHDMPLLTARGKNNILSIEESAGELRFLIEVIE